MVSVSFRNGLVLILIPIKTSNCLQTEALIAGFHSAFVFLLKVIQPWKITLSSGDLWQREKEGHLLQMDNKSILCSNCCFGRRVKSQNNGVMAVRKKETWNEGTI